MSTTFRRYAPEQSLLLPPDVREWLPEGHLSHHISDLVDGLDLTAFYAGYEGDGRRNAPYEPRMLVKVLLYAYATGVFSSRGIARKLEEDVAFRVLAAGNFPQHRTICEFRRRHLDDFKQLFVEVVGLARELGLARFGKLSVDGTKVRANASKRKAMSYGRMQEEERRLSGEIDELLRAADETDVAEDVRLGPEVRGDELPAELRRREDRLAAIRAAKARLEAAQRAADDARGRQAGQARNPKGGRPYKRAYGEPDEKAQSNFTDPESGIMKTGNEGFQQCYNAQAAVDAEHQLVVATDVTANASDQGGLPVLLDAVQERFAPGGADEDRRGSAWPCPPGDYRHLREAGPRDPGDDRSAVAGRCTMTGEAWRRHFADLRRVAPSHRLHHATGSTPPAGLRRASRTARPRGPGRAGCRRVGLGERREPARAAVEHCAWIPHDGPRGRARRRRARRRVGAHEQASHPAHPGAPRDPRPDSPWKKAVR